MDSRRSASVTQANRAKQTYLINVPVPHLRVLTTEIVHFSDAFLGKTSGKYRLVGLGSRKLTLRVCQYAKGLSIRLLSLERFRTLILIFRISFFFRLFSISLHSLWYCCHACFASELLTLKKKVWVLWVLWYLYIPLSPFICPLVCWSPPFSIMGLIWPITPFWSR